jgi:hypothetical protein
MSYPLRLIARAKLAERQGTYIVIGRKRKGKAAVGAADWRTYERRGKTEIAGTPGGWRKK